MLNEKRDELVSSAMTSGVIWSRDTANTTKRNAHLADLAAFDVKTFYKSADGQSWQVIFYDLGNETVWAEFPVEQRADKTVTKLNELLAGGWNPNL